jgi:putative ABC transport system ATP-binding protein
MDLLKRLHREGSTLCMVTHDPRYASYADRTIRLFDGCMVEETQRAHPHKRQWNAKGSCGIPAFSK